MYLFHFYFIVRLFEFDFYIFRLTDAFVIQQHFVFIYILSIFFSTQMLHYFIRRNSKNLFKIHH
ncbi:hypothetical protein A7P25_12945 [Achromobacter xylosoxidans]|nr:hypothetical protein A7P25_12945 [Achromobacter xylosoxidans]